MNIIHQKTQNNNLTMQLEENENNNFSNARLDDILKSRNINKENADKTKEEKKERIWFNNNDERNKIEEKKSNNNDAISKSNNQKAGSVSL